MTAPEWSRPVRLDTIGTAPRTVTIEADEAERAALARRFGLIGIERIEATAAISARADGVHAEGRVRAAVTQRCVATDVPLSVTVDEPFALLFTEAADEGADEDEIELAADALDTLPIEDGTIDLGEAAAESLALALDPYPRAPDADAVLAAAGVRVAGEEERAPGAFAALAALKDKLG